jgi:hypothetical protein
MTLNITKIVSDTNVGHPAMSIAGSTQFGDYGRGYKH